MKNFQEFINENSDQGKFDIINNDLLTEIKEYLLTNYPSDWWNREFSERVFDYISQDEVVGDGDEDDESTWEYESEEDAYQNLCTGGAIEYDLLEDIRKDIIKHFHLSEEEYDRNKIYDIIENHMINMIDWYDALIFGENSDDFFGLNKGVSDILKFPDEINGIKL